MKLLCPEQVLSSVFEVDLDWLLKKGIKGLLIDLDNTLICWDSDEITSDFSQWIENALNKGFKMCIVSNGMSVRVQKFAKLMNIPAVPKAVKPRRKPFKNAMNLLGMNSDQVAMIGDQLFTDILGGNRLGIHTILIDPLSKNELKSTKLVRKIERGILTRFARQGLVNAERIKRRHGGNW